MKTLLPRKPLVALVATTLLVTSPLAGAAGNGRYDDPSYGSMIVDAAVARPLGFGATVVGSAIWVVTLPFSALGGNMKAAAGKLIVEPARFTFTRPLGEL